MGPLLGQVAGQAVKQVKGDVDHGFSVNYVSAQAQTAAYDNYDCMCASRGSRLRASTSANASSTEQDQWIIDSGATHHVSPDVDVVTHKTGCSGPGKLVVGDGVSLSVGLVRSKIMKYASRILLVNDLLHVPGITQNLLSVSKFARDNNVVFELCAQSCCVRDAISGEAVVLITFGIEACCIGKSRKLPFSDSKTAYAKPFNWSQALNTFKVFQQMAATQFGLAVKAVQSDWGGEYRSLSTILLREWIEYRVACPHTYEQNGVVERKHRHVIELALVLLAQAAMPLRYWYYAAATAVFLINRLPTRVLEGLSPCEKLFEKKPDYGFMRVFGCKYFPHLWLFQQHKLDFRSQPCTFLGYSPQHKGYLCLATNGRIYITRHVVFDEFVFPFAGIGESSNMNQVNKQKSAELEVVTDVRQLNANTFGSSQGTTSANMDMDGLTETVPQEMVNESEDVMGGNSGHMHHNLSGRGEPSPETVTPNLGESSLGAASREGVHVGGVTTEAVELANLRQSVATTDLVDNATSSSDSNSYGVVNRHSMMTRSKCDIFKPKVYVASCAEMEPLNVHEVVQSPHWKAAVLAEFEALRKNGTWTLVKLPEGRSVVGYKWLFKLKKNPYGSINRYKARLVAKGYSQMPGYDFGETFSPVVRFTTLNIVLSLAVTNDWQLRQVDVNNAFMYGDLHEEVFMQQPPSFEQVAADGSPLVCRLEKAMYGLRQAPRNWHDKLKNYLLKIGFKESSADTSLFVCWEGSNCVYILVYVDDIVLTGNSNEKIEEVVKFLGREFALKDLGDLHYFLGIEVKRSGSSLVLSQRKFILELLMKTKISTVNPASTPMFASAKLSHDTGTLLLDAYEYRSIVGALLYLVGTINHGLVIAPAVAGFNIVAFADADWAASADDRKSISGYCVYVGDNLVLWNSKKQKSVFRSTMEAEYRSVADVTAETTWVNSLLNDLGVARQKTPIVWCDNSSVVAMTANPVYHAKSKHVELDVHFVREKVALKQVLINYVPGSHHVAYGFTKPLAAARFEVFKARVNVQSFLWREEEEAGRMLNDEPT
ncbi:hypothetical protein F3Y22_tig00109971pilonHSYRG00141 [Hibiscus syriacus]|uniref:Integrase catalytic domain-containing protein n=1 Tax=Hibiscus syriacus TaxID=106335 RepID=A0A6A3BR49_HIBSY|nr:hypothetical protein F3Y22_tig00109971pilonHSYRG00141 [Hibiscus syriacus]